MKAKTIGRGAFGCLAAGVMLVGLAMGQEEAGAPADAADEPAVVADGASMTTEIGANGGRLVVEATGLKQKVPLFFSGDAKSRVTIGEKAVAYAMDVRVKVLQGKAKALSLGLLGSGEIVRVGGPVASWSVRREGNERFLDIVPSGEGKDAAYEFQVEGRLNDIELPREVSLLRLQAGKAVSFSDTVTVATDAKLAGRLVRVSGYAPLESEDDRVQSYQSTGWGASLDYLVERSDGLTASAELTGLAIAGTVNEKDGFASFVLTGTAEVRKDDAELVLLRGRAAVEQTAMAAGRQLRLEDDGIGNAVYTMKFDKAGRYPLEVKFVTRLAEKSEWKGFDFRVPGGAVVPITLTGVAADSEFHDQAPVVPGKGANGSWRGFLPADGNASVAWKPLRKTGEGKLFFTTAARVNVGVGAGLLRQTTEIDYQILQGELDTLTMSLEGPGEVLAVEGNNVLGWKVSGTDGARVLEVQLSQPIESAASLQIRSQLALGAFPTRGTPLRVQPEGSIRHSGHVRVYNIGATRLEVVGVTGLTQLSPEQFPAKGAPEGARQIFVYRFPAAAHTYEVAASRVEPEVNVSQVVVYTISESDRVIRADVELDIREAPLRSWNLMVPADYSVVSATGAEVADSVVGTQIDNGERTLKVIFGKEVSGRQLVSLHLEQNTPAEPGEWVLPRLRFPEAKSVRGDVGVATVAGFRVSLGTIDKLSEKPISYFPKKTERLQQAFRVREREWSATMVVEKLAQSVQADVFHLYALKDQTAYASVVCNYFVTGAPVLEWKIQLPPTALNVSVEGEDVRTWREEENVLIVNLHQPVIGAFTLLVTYEEEVGAQGGAIRPGQVVPLDVRGERGFIQVVSPVQVKTTEVKTSKSLLSLDPTELPAEFRLLSSAPSKATYQYTARPVELEMGVEWFEPGDTVRQVVEFSEAKSQVSRDGDVVTNVTYFVKTRGQRVLRVYLPKGAQLWAVEVAGKTVSARDDGDWKMIPLPPGVDVNQPVQVSLRIAQASANEKLPVLNLPAVAAPTLKTEWRIKGDQGRTLIPKSKNLSMPVPVLTETGLEWIASRALVITAVMVLLLALGVWLRSVGAGNHVLKMVGIACVGAAVVLAFMQVGRAGSEVRPNLDTLEYTLPVVQKGQAVSLVVENATEFSLRVNGLGIVAMVVGVGLLLWSVWTDKNRVPIRLGGAALLTFGILVQRGGAVMFYALAGLVMAIILLVFLIRWWGDWHKDWNAKRAQRAKEREEARAKALQDAEKKKEKDDGDDLPPLPGASTASLLVFGLLLSLGGFSEAQASEKAPPPLLPPGYEALSSLKQDWTIVEERLTATGELTVNGEPGDRFVLLKEPGIMTSFEGAGLHVGKHNVPGCGMSYVVTVRDAPGVAGADPAGPRMLRATFAYEMPSANPQGGVTVPTGVASIHSLAVRYDKAGWEFDAAGAMRAEALPGVKATESGARLLLAPGRDQRIEMRPKARDVAAEESKYFVEAANLFLPSPGVVDGVHRIQVRPSQGELKKLTLKVPAGFTVSEVGGGPVGMWQFDADAGTLEVVIEPAQAQAFSLTVQTQGGLDPLPSETTLAPVSVTGAANEVGLLALAFGPEAQPEKEDAIDLSAVNLADFDQGMIPQRRGGKPVLHSVFRYGKTGGSLALRVAPVAPEVRVSSKQVLSIGDERLVLGVNFVADITRAGVFQLSFPLPEGLEVESLSGPALNHWTELTENGQRLVIMHLNGKTLGQQQFALSLAGMSPKAAPEGWTVPKLSLREAKRQTGELVVKPTPGIRLRTLSRKSVSEIDPRTLGGQGEGALAFRILQDDWALALGIEKLDPWVTGSILHEVTLREGQTRTSLVARMKVDNASVRSIRVKMPGLSEEEAKTVRASGTSVSDIVQVEGEEGLWELQFKRRMLGALQVRLDYERTGERTGGVEELRVVEFPDLRQTSYYFAVRAGVRMGPEVPKLAKGWQQTDWNAVPQKLRESGDRSIPDITLRAVAVEGPQVVTLQPRSVSDTLDLRVAGGEITSVWSPVGDVLTSVDLHVEVVQRGALKVLLPKGGELYNAFVNGESVTVVRNQNHYQFYILPGADDRTAKVRFVYRMPGQKPGKLQLGSPKLNVPLENIEWRVVVPSDWELVDSDGDLDLVDEQFGAEFDKRQYLTATQAQRKSQAKQAEDLLEKANVYLQAGEQTKARLALNSVANNYALDAASNEDARVQLRELQTQQAIVGLNTRRQRMYLDNRSEDMDFEVNSQLEQAAVRNGIINMGEVRFRPQEFGQFLEGNTKEENLVLQRIATRLVAHQRSTEPAPQAISVTLPEEGRVFKFSRRVQVKENAPLTLELQLKSPQVRNSSREAVAILVILALLGLMVFGLRRKKVSA